MATNATVYKPRTNPAIELERCVESNVLQPIARRIVYRTLGTKWLFEDFPTFVLAENAMA